jgi:hypothetical protein
LGSVIDFKVVEPNEARRIAANIAKLPELFLGQSQVSNFAQTPSG